MGREVATFVDEMKEAGEHSVTFDARNLPSGVYFYQLKTNGHSQTKKMALIQ
ncbi:MAG: T9SS type A sorting domain-containing protein [Bacteroidetes bacterium]|nr:T9SS type A sorting domain-containing protein [Bacteroidota bacterium]MCW5895991.1 T9SS type A sorting domain-containing protein [Bacteroidota bacterium]